MNDSIYQRIDTNPRFKELVAKRERFAWILSSIMLGLYVIFILLIAFQLHEHLCCLLLGQQTEQQGQRLFIVQIVR